MQERPIVDRQIDDNEARSGKLLVELFAHIHIARCDQLQREIVQPRIMADDCKRMRLARFADGADQRFRTGVINTFIGDHARCLGKGCGDQRPGLLRPFCRRDQGEVGKEAVMRHISADRRSVGATAFHQLAVAVALARRGALGFGVAEQHQSAHRGNVAFRAQPV